MFTKKLPAILRTFHKALDDLKSLQDHHDTHIDVKNEEVIRLNAEVADHRAEKRLAADIHTNISKLVGLPKQS